LQHNRKKGFCDARGNWIYGIFSCFCIKLGNQVFLVAIFLEMTDVDKKRGCEGFSRNQIRVFIHLEQK